MVEQAMTVLLGVVLPLLACTSNAAPGQPGGSALQKGAYEPSTGLEVAYAPAKSPARFYLQDGKLVLAYLSGPAVADIPPDTLSAAHPAAAELPSRAGKTFYK
jgi:hypothetical protein